MALVLNINNNIKNGNELYNFCFITSSYNQSSFIEKNLNSIKMQIYRKYRVIYVNDASTDNSKEILINYKKKNPNFPIELIHNKKRLGPAYSRYVAYNKCFDNEICIFLDGDDFLMVNNVLNILNEVYKIKDIKATFGNSLNVKFDYNLSNIYDRMNKKKYYPHLRTCYAYYVKKIPKKYLQDSDGYWFKFCTDVALFTSLIEIIGNNYCFIKNNLMEYNLNNSLNNLDEGYSHQNKKGKLIREKYHNDIKNMKKLEPLIKYVDLKDKKKKLIEIKLNENINIFT